LIRRLALRRCTTMLPSRTLQRIALEVWRLPSAKLALVPNGFDLARFAGELAPAPWPEQEGAVIGTVAVLRPEKKAHIIYFRAMHHEHQPESID
jgi:hypothetical protein